MKRQIRLNSSEQEQQHSAEQTQQSGREFHTPEEMIRYDARQTAVPDAVGIRLRQSAADLPSAARPWWKRLFRGK